jgi:hypothetical protein
MEFTTPDGMRGLLLILDNIENNSKLDAKLPSAIKAKGADVKCKMELTDSYIPKKP